MKPMRGIDLAETVIRVRSLFNRGLDTVEISHHLHIRESDAYTLLHTSSAQVSIPGPTSRLWKVSGLTPPKKHGWGRRATLVEQNDKS